MDKGGATILTPQTSVAMIDIGKCCSTSSTQPSSHGSSTAAPRTVNPRLAYSGVNKTPSTRMQQRHPPTGQLVLAKTPHTPKSVARIYENYYTNDPKSYALPSIHGEYLKHCIERRAYWQQFRILPCFPSEIPKQEEVSSQRTRIDPEMIASCFRPIITTSPGDSLSAPSMALLQGLPQVKRRVRCGFWNQYGDHLTDDGLIVEPPYLHAFPEELRDYPLDEDEKFMNEFGVFISLDEIPAKFPRARRIHAPRMPLGVLPDREYIKFYVSASYYLSSHLFSFLIRAVAHLLYDIPLSWAPQGSTASCHCCFLRGSIYG
jgi:hypothetical protein